ncbi:Translation initiation factor 2A [Gracilaria domingensis]|nr:Translation initiation factor 2A [Gracilaria domingensis]
MASTKQSIQQTVHTRPLAILVREKTRAFITQFPYQEGTESEERRSLLASRDSQFAPNGDCFFSIEGDNQEAVIRDSVTTHVICSCGGLGDKQTPLKVDFAAFSPRGTYLLTWCRPVSGVSVRNLKLFHIGFWPSIQWSDDESIAAHCVTNNVHFYKSDALDKPPYAILRVPGVSKFALSPGPAPFTIATFIPSLKGSPGKLCVFKHPDEGGEELASRSTFNADSVSFKWNSKGKAVLALVSTNIDNEGKSYYGNSEVYYMDNLGVFNQRVDLPQEGPTFSAAWSPTGNEFIIIYGFMPARATMFNEKCEPVFDFGTGARNEIHFSPHGRFVALGGFGNLAGAVEFWDKNKMSLVGRAQMPCTTMCSWSPCSRYFLGATTFPRLRVDNGFKVVRFDGKLVHEQKLGDGHLYQAVFKPALRVVYADPKLTMDDMIGGPIQSADESRAANGNTKQSAGVYRPPGSRGMASTLKLHHHLAAGKVDKSAFLSSGVGNSASAPRSSGGKKIVPGMDPDMVDGPSKAAIARRKKKERDRQLKAKQAAESAPTEQSNAANTNPQDIASIADAEKRAKRLKKKLRGIEALEVSKAEGKELNQEQEDKLQTKSDVQNELEAVEKRISELSVS